MNGNIGTANDQQTSDIVIRDYWLLVIASSIIHQIMHKCHLAIYLMEKCCYIMKPMKVRIAFKFHQPLVCCDVYLVCMLKKQSFKKILIFSLFQGIQRMFSSCIQNSSICLRLRFVFDVPVPHMFTAFFPSR